MVSLGINSLGISISNELSAFFRHITLTYTRIGRASTVHHGPIWAEPNLPLFRVEVWKHDRRTNFCTIDATGKLQRQIINNLQSRGAAKPVRQVFSRQVFPRFHISSFLISCFLISHSCFYQYPRTVPSNQIGEGFKFCSLIGSHGWRCCKNLEKRCNVLSNISCHMGRGQSRIWDHQSDCRRLNYNRMT